MSAQDPFTLPPSSATAQDAPDELVASLSVLDLSRASLSPQQHDEALKHAHSKENPLLHYSGTRASSPYASDATTAPPPPPHQTTPRSFVLFQPACAGHHYARGTDIGTIVERPERLRAIKTGVAAAWARLEKQDGERWKPLGLEQEKDEDEDELGDLLSGLSLTGGTQKGAGKGKKKEVRGGAFDILESSAVLAVDDPSIRFIHPSPNHAPDAAADAAWLTSFSSAASSANPATPSRLTRATSSSPSKLTLPLPAASFGTSPSPLSAPPPWPSQLQHLCRRSSTAILSHPFSEIPPHLPQGDLYLTPESEEAIFGALGAVCEGVDRIVKGEKGGGDGYDRAFVAIRPPGHHCGESNPQGFCFVNNVAVAAAHAYLTHGINRVVILDVDLHHGNGTQELVWRINAEAQRIVSEREQQRSKTPSSSPRKSSPRKGAVPLPSAKPEPEPLRIMYGSMHDIWSYPCEDGDPSLVSAASLTLSGGHCQHISNVHLEPFASEDDFHERLYPKYREGLLGVAERFCEQTGGGKGKEEEDGKRTLVIVSAGFDASEHEHASMSRHSRNVPTSFYRRFALDVVRFAQQRAGGKVLSALEGGYSDRALASGSAAFLTGLVAREEGEEETGGKDKREKENEWWEEKELGKLEKACSVAKVKRGGGGGGGSGFVSGARGLVGAVPGRDDSWLVRAVEVFSHLEGSPTLPPPPPPPATKRDDEPPAAPMQLRERKVRHNYAGLNQEGTTPSASPTAARATGGRRVVSPPAPKNAAASPPPPLSTVPPLPANLPSLPAGLPPLPPTVPTVSSSADSAIPVPSSTTGGNPKIRFTFKQGGIGGEPRM
ncbi:hypothetical protein JCM8547_000871 [Rhodosporidiobolus lusitaniae]